MPDVINNLFGGMTPGAQTGGNTGNTGPASENPPQPNAGAENPSTGAERLDPGRQFANLLHMMMQQAMAFDAPAREDPDRARRLVAGMNQFQKD